MFKQMSLFIAILLISSPAFAGTKKVKRIPASGASLEKIVRMAEKNSFVKQAIQYAKKTAGRNAFCKKEDSDINADQGTVTMRGSCNVNTTDNETSVMYEIKGVWYEDTNDIMVENITFHFAG